MLMRGDIFAASRGAPPFILLHELHSPVLPPDRHRYWT